MISMHIYIYIYIYIYAIYIYIYIYIYTYIYTHTGIVDAEDRRVRRLDDPAHVVRIIISRCIIYTINVRIVIITQ